jgi:Arm DNA-binding domain
MYLNGQTRFYSTELYVKPLDWNDKKDVPKSPALQRKINQLFHELATFEADYRKEHHSFNLNNFDGFGKLIADAIPLNISFTTFMVAQHEAEKVLNQPSWRDRKLTIIPKAIETIEGNFELYPDKSKFLNFFQYEIPSVISRYKLKGIKKETLLSCLQWINDKKIDLEKEKAAQGIVREV